VSALITEGTFNNGRLLSHAASRTAVKGTMIRISQGKFRGYTRLQTGETTTIEDGTGSEQKCNTSTSSEHSFDQLFLVVLEYDLK